MVNQLYGGSENPDAVGIDDGSDIEEISEEDLEMWRKILSPAEFEKIYGQFL